MRPASRRPRSPNAAAYRLAARGLCVLLVAALPCVAFGQTLRRPIRDFYQFVEIDRAERPGAVGTPSLSDGGTVAYFKRIQLPPPGPCILDPTCRAGIAVGDETGVAFVAELADGFRSFSGPPTVGSAPPSAVTAGSRTAFKAYLDDTGNTGGIFLADDTTIATLALEFAVDPHSPFRVLGEPAINDRGLVAFSAEMVAGGSAVYTINGTSMSRLVGSESGLLADGCCIANVAINDDGLVSFVAQDEEGVDTIFTTNGFDTVPLVDTRGPFAAFPGAVISMNVRGEVSFYGRLDDGGHGLFATDGAGVWTVALEQDADPASPFRTISRGGHSINAEGVVAFAANTVDGDGIFVGTDPVNDRIVGELDTIFDTPVLAIGLFWTRGLNDRRQIAFTASLETGTALYRGDFQREAMTIDIQPGSRKKAIRPSSRKRLRVALLGSAAFDVADVDPSTLALGPHGAAPTKLKRKPRLKDVNKDGFDDLLVKFSVSDTGIGFGDQQACLTGEKLDGTPFRGCDAIETQTCGDAPKACLQAVAAAISF